MKKFFEYVLTGVGVVGVIALFIALLAIMPFAFIWSVNTLFNFKIAFTAWNWLVALVLLACIRS